MYRFIRISALACVMLCVVSCKAGLSDPPVPLDGNLSDPAGLPAVFIGASIIQYWQSYTDFPAQQWIDMGIAGQKCADVLARVQSDVIAKQPATMHLLCGTNDILHGPTD